MRLPYHELEIGLEAEGLIAIESIRIYQRLNEHGQAFIKALVREELAVENVERAEQGMSVTIRRKGEGGRQIFCGRVCSVRAGKEGGLYYLYVECMGYTSEWDLTEKYRSFCREKDTYRQVMGKVLSEYPEKEVRDEASGGATVPGMLLQYGETDWEFLKRLASHFSTFLLPDDTQGYGKVYFGIPHMETGITLGEEEYTVLRGRERHGGMVWREGLVMAETTCWHIRSRKTLRLGEMVKLGYVEAVVISVDIHTEKGEPVTEYILARRKGILSEKRKNPKIYGMSIPATVKERKGNQVRVHLDIDSVYEKADDLKWFTYAIETSNFYCMPEEGSRVHVYFPSHDEQDAMAVHALSSGSLPGGPAEGFAGKAVRGTGAAVETENGVPGGGHAASGAATKSAKAADMAPSSAPARASVQAGAGNTGKTAKNPDHKVLSDPAGSRMELEPAGITFAPGGGMAGLRLDKSGSLSIRGISLSFLSDTTIYLGGGGYGPGVRTSVKALGGIKLSLTGGASCMTMDRNTEIMSAFIHKEAEQKKEALPPAGIIAAELKAGDGAVRDQINAMAEGKLVTAVVAKQEEAGVKIRNGISKGVGGALATVAIVVTAPVSVPMVIGIGAGAAYVGTSAYANISEGCTDMEKLAEGDLSKSYNVMRDEFFQGNEEDYLFWDDTICALYEVVGSVSTAVNLSKPGNTRKAAVLFQNLTKGIRGSEKAIKGARYGINMLGSMAGDARNDFIYGKLSSENALYSMGKGAVKALTLDILQFPAGSSYFTKNITRKAANALIDGTVGSAADVAYYALREERVSMAYILGMNMALAGVCQVLADPVDAASGAYLLASDDLIFPGMLEPVRLSRRYASVNGKEGWMGKGWHFSYEGRLCRDGETLHVELPDGYCAAFVPVEEGYANAAGNGRYRLSHDVSEGQWEVLDTHLHKTFRYSAEGLLLSERDRNGCRLTLEYRGDYPEKMITVQGTEIRFTFRDGKLGELEDSTGRTMHYRYDGGFLTEVVHVEGSVSRYAYTAEGYLETPTDQNGTAYLTNRYDGKGRVVLQTLASGESYGMEYDDRKRCVHARRSGYPGERVYTYSERMAVTEIRYPDGTEETFAYDGGNNRILERDREGRSVRREYDASGRLVKETRPGGPETGYVYDGNGDLTLVHDSGGRELSYVYDGNHNPVLRREKVSEGAWTEEAYAWDRMGRLVSERDGTGNVTRYRYEGMSPYPCRIVYADGSECSLEYDALGRRLAEEDGAGRTEYAYSRSGWRTMVRDGEGNETHLLYNGSGQVYAFYTPTQWKAGKGERTEYRYDFLGRRVETRYPDGSREKRFLDGEGNVVKEVHPNAYDGETGDGEGTRYEYDGENRLLRIRHADGGTERFFYDGSGNLVKHVLPGQYDAETDDGAGRCYGYDEGNRLASVTGPDGTPEKTFRRDPWGNCVEETDAEGYRTLYAYDLCGRMTGKLEPAGRDGGKTYYRMTSYAYDGNGNRTRETRHGGKYGEDWKQWEAGTDLVLSFSYDAWNRLLRAWDGLGAEVSYSYDGRGNRTGETRTVGPAGDGTGRTVLRRIVYLYDRAGRLAEKRETLDSGLERDGGGMPEVAVTEYGRDADGNVTCILTPEGYRIRREYDARGRLVLERAEDKGNGIDRKTFLAYDAAGNVISVRRQGAEGQERETRYAYDAADRLAGVTEGDVPLFLAAYDADGRLAARKAPLPSGGWGCTAYEYDPRGNLSACYADGIRTVRNGYDGKNRRVETVDADGVRTRFRYGAQDMPLEILTAAGLRQGKAAQSLSFNARGHVTGIRDGNGGETSLLPDGWGRTVSVRTAEGGTETYAYDYAGNLSESVDANGGRIRYAYNSQGKVCRITYQDGSGETFRHDREGRETEHTDRNGTVTRTAYNLYGQPTGKTCTDRDGRRRVMGTWEYDSLGRLKKAVAGGYRYTYGYRPDGKLLWKRSNGRKVLSCGYYPDGSLESVTDVTGMCTRYEYDASGRLERLRDGEGRTLAEYRYTAAGRIRETRVAGGIKTTYGYDGDGNLERLSAGTEDGGTLLYDAFLLYDLNGNRTGKTGTRTGADGKREGMAVTYRYDRMNRLVCEDRGGEGERYAYDPAGNRLEREHYRDGAVDGAETYCYNERNELTCRVNRLTGSAAAYRYDACGNLLLEEEGGKKKEYGYDALNRLARVRTVDGRVWENLYDGEGLRAGTRGDGACTAFLYRNGEILAECGEDGEPVSRYVYGSGLSHVQTLRDGVYHAYHRDEQGSTAYMTGPGGGVENSYRYDAFGNLLERKETVPNRILYTGQRYDQETGQYYLRARYYNPVVGRFLQEDTYHGDGLNLYAYCGNNPVVYYDPGGHDSAAVMKKAEEPDLPVGVGKGGRVPKVTPSRLADNMLDANFLTNANTVKDKLPRWAKNKGNFGYSEVDIDGLDNIQFFAHSSIQTEIPGVKDSGISIKPESSPFKTVEVNASNVINGEGAWPRDVDTEYKILSDIQSKLGDNPSASGKIKLYTELEPCPSCQSVIEQFKEMYPNIDIEVIYSIKK